MKDIKTVEAVVKAVVITCVIVAVLLIIANSVFEFVPRRLGNDLLAVPIFIIIMAGAYLISHKRDDDE